MKKIKVKTRKGVSRRFHVTGAGKIMRRILRKLAAGEFEGLGDTSTLAEASVVDDLIKTVKSA